MSFVALYSCREKSQHDIALSAGPKFLGDTITLQRKGNNEDTNINSDIRVTVTGVRPDDGAATVAGADERHANYCAGENKEDAS